MSEGKWSNRLHHFYGTYDLSSKEFRVGTAQNSVHKALFKFCPARHGNDVVTTARLLIDHFHLTSHPYDLKTSYPKEGRNYESVAGEFFSCDYPWKNVFGETRDLSLHLHVKFRFPAPDPYDEYDEYEEDCTCISDPNFTFPSLKLSPPPPPPFLLTLSANLAKQFLREDTADVWFEIGNEVIPAHKWILMARVEVFEKMFESGMAEAKTSRIAIEDTDGQTFKRMLKFVYCGELPDDIESTADVLLPVAEKYDLQELKEACASTLKAGVNERNALQTMILADLYQCSDLLRHCVKYMTQKPMDKETLEPLKAYPHLLIELLTFKNSKD